MDLGISGKTAIVTGGSQGIGKAIASHLAAEGVKTVIKIYKLGGASKDKNIEKMAKFTSEQELENWVKSKLS